jgi:ArsR family transcriptional regulator, arsenate/arsenite/antimonite-responsive transcriptional repressor
MWLPQKSTRYVRSSIFVKPHMDKDVEAVDRVFKALADPTRIRILGLLAAGEICVCHIYESLRLPQSLVSRHLAYLRRAGLVETRKDGLWVHYRIAPRHDDVTGTLLDAVYHCVGHLSAIGKDAKRLERKTGCCAVALPAPSFECCRAIPVETVEEFGRQAVTFVSCRSRPRASS